MRSLGAGKCGSCSNSKQRSLAHSMPGLFLFLSIFFTLAWVRKLHTNFCYRVTAICRLCLQSFILVFIMFDPKKKRKKSDISFSFTARKQVGIHIIPLYLKPNSNDCTMNTWGFKHMYQKRSNNEITCKRHSPRSISLCPALTDSMQCTIRHYIQYLAVR